MNLKGGLPQMIFAAAWTAVYALALGGLTAFFSPGVPFDWVEAGGLELKVYANREGAANIDVDEGDGTTTRIAVTDLSELITALTDLERQRQELLGGT